MRIVRKFCPFFLVHYLKKEFIITFSADIVDCCIDYARTWVFISPYSTVYGHNPTLSFVRESVGWWRPISLHVLWGVCYQYHCNFSRWASINMWSWMFSLGFAGVNLQVEYRKSAILIESEIRLSSNLLTNQWSYQKTFLKK